MTVTMTMTTMTLTMTRGRGRGRGRSSSRSRKFQKWAAAATLCFPCIYFRNESIHLQAKVINKSVVKQNVSFLRKIFFVGTNLYTGMHGLWSDLRIWKWIFLHRSKSASCSNIYLLICCRISMLFTQMCELVRDTSLATGRGAPSINQWFRGRNCWLNVNDKSDKKSVLQSRSRWSRNYFRTWSRSRSWK